MIDQREPGGYWNDYSKQHVTRIPKSSSISFSTSKPVKKSEVYHAYNLGVDNFKDARLDAFQAAFSFVCFNDIIYETDTGLIVKDCKYHELATM